MNDFITIIITTYNRASLLERAIQSVLDQTYNNFELLIIDNGSTDNTLQIIKKFTDTRLKYFCFTENKGGPAARNEGIRRSKGNFIAFLDDDDEWLPTKIEKQLQLFHNCDSKVGLVYVGCSQIQSPSRHIIKNNLATTSGNLYPQLLHGSLIGSVSRVMVKKVCFEKVGMFDEALKSCQDWDMWLRISEKFEFAAIPEILVKIYVHNVQISRNLKSLIAGRELMITKHYQKFLATPKILIQHLKRLGKLRCFNNEWQDAWQWFNKAAALDKTQWLNIFAWLILEFPFQKIFRYRSFI